MNVPIVKFFYICYYCFIIAERNTKILTLLCISDLFCNCLLIEYLSYDGLTGEITRNVKVKVFEIHEISTFRIVS